MMHRRADDEPERLITAIGYYIFVFVPPIFFGTVLFIGPAFIPLQLLTIIGFMIAQFTGRIGKVDWPSYFGGICWAFFVMLLLLSGTLLASHWDPDVELFKQLSIRGLFVLYALVVFIWLRSQGKFNRRAIGLSIWTLRILFIYGVYEVFAKFLGLPLFLSFLLNNPSYSNALEVTSAMSGWADFFRAQSIWPEPSFALLPIVLFFVLSDTVKNGVGKLDLAIIAAFAVATFSRSVWIGLAVILIARLSIFRSRQLIFAVALSAVFSLALVNTNEEADWSASVRSTTALQGLEIANEQGIRGIGFNKFKDTPQAGITGESVIHNTLSNYVASMGWPIGVMLVGLMLCPFLLFRDRSLSYLLPVCIVLIFTISDMFYFTTLFFLIAYAQAKNLSIRPLVP